jgi:hypothetical protein
VRNRNGCRTPSQSGLNLKYRADNSRGTEGIVIRRISEELHDQNSPSTSCSSWIQVEEYGKLVQDVVESSSLAGILFDRFFALLQEGNLLLRIAPKVLNFAKFPERWQAKDGIDVNR